MNFLVLGSEGQIGGYLTEFLRKKGHAVTQWDIKISPDHDLTKPSDRLDEEIEKADFVFFLAYDVGGAKYLKRYQDSFEFIRNNNLIMAHTFEALKKHGKRFVFASSQMVRLHHSNYGRLKTIGEAYSKALGGIFSRFWNVYGLEIEEEKAHVITDFIKHAHYDREIKMLTDGKEVRQFLFADDCCEALYTIFERYDDFLAEEKYAVDISSFEWNSIADVADIVSEEFPGTKVVPGHSVDDIQKSSVDRFEPSGEILKYWKPKTSLRDGIRLVIDRMRDQDLLAERATLEKPLVSTITPCFRMKRYLPKFLEELPKQTYFDKLEIVLDHNEPDEEEIRWVEEFNRKYPGKIKHIIVDKVDPIGTSMNRCIKEASGDLLTIWNVDDLRTPESIESQVHAITEKNGDVAMGDYRVVRSFGDTEGGYMVTHAHFPESEYKRSMLLGPFLMFKKSLCKKAGYFDEQLKSGADYDFSIRLAYNGTVVPADDMLGYYLNEGKGASTRPDSKQPLERTVIELRYGVFDKLDMSYIPLTINYSIPHIISFGQAHPVSDYVKDYAGIVQGNIKEIRKSMVRSTLMSLTGYQRIKSAVKNRLKKILYENNSSTGSQK